MKKAIQIQSFLKVTAVCSFLGALTTALLIFLPSPSAPDFESQLLLSSNRLYLTKLWVLFLHPQLNLIASLGLAYLLFRRYPTYIILGTLFLSVWAYTEMSQQALLIDALNQIWRPGYLSSSGDALIVYETLIKGAAGISDSNYFIVIYGFGLGSFFYGLAFTNEGAFKKSLGISLLFIGVLSCAAFSSYYLGATILSPAVNWCYTWVYPYLQPLVRVALGVWILTKLKGPSLRIS